MSADSQREALLQHYLAKVDDPTHLFSKADEPYIRRWVAELSAGEVQRLYAKRCGEA